MFECSKPGRRALLRALGAAGIAATFPAAAADSTGAPSVESLHELRVMDGKVPDDERLISAKKGDRLRLRVTSNTAGELHLHAYRLSVKVTAGQSADLAFDAFATGRFQIEWHPAASNGSIHDGAVLASLEVRPT